MTWARLDDRWHDHPKVIAAGLDGAGLWAMCLTWAHHDHARAVANGQPIGVVPDGVVSRFAGPKAKRLARTLHAVGLFDAHTGAGWPIHDYVKFLPKHDPEQAKAAGAAGGRARAAKRTASKALSEPLTEALSEPLAESVANGKQPPKRNQARAGTGASVRAYPDPDPDPEPEVPPVETLRGGGQYLNGRDHEPPPRCPRHLDDPAPGPCPPCGDARREHERWTRDRDQARRDAGTVVGGLECVEHPGQPAGRCGRCTAAAVPMPPDLRQHRTRRAS